MFPLIIQLPQSPTCCAIQLAIWPHHAGEAVPPLVETELAAIHCWHVVCSVVALPHIIAPVMRSLLVDGRIVCALCRHRPDRCRPRCVLAAFIFEIADWRIGERRATKESPMVVDVAQGRVTY
jgi:hypothetical protein